MTHAAALQSAAISTFEELAFLLPSIELDEVQAAAEPVASAVVEFRGAGAGRLHVRVCGRPLLTELAANMLGTAMAPGDAMQRDALGELANVICGNVLPAVAGVEAVFSLSAPKVALGGGTAFSGPGDVVTLGLPEGRIVLGFRFDPA